MARPSEFKRDEAIDIIMKEIWLNGFEASSVKSLSERLGITRSSFYNAFGSREAAFKEALSQYFKLSPDNILSEATPKTKIRPLLAKTFREICRVRATDHEAKGCMVLNSVSELCPVHEELSSALTNAMLGSIDRIEQLLKWAKENGEIPDSYDTKSMALAVQNLMIGINVMSKIIRSEKDLWTTASITLNGLGLLEE